MFLLGIAAELRAGVMYGITGGQNSNSTLYTIDLGTAAITFLDPPSLKTSRTGLAFDSGDDLYLKDWNQLFAVDPLTAQSASVGSVAGASNLHNVLEFGESGTLFTVSRQGSQSLLYTLDTADASATLVGDIGIANISALAYEESTVAVIEPGAGAFLGLGFLELG